MYYKQQFSEIIDKAAWKMNFVRRFCSRLAAVFTCQLCHERNKDSDQTKACSTKSAAINRCTEYINLKMVEIGCPGLVIGVSVNGKNVWTKGFGYADLENNVQCSSNTVMRIASISKSITMAAVGKLIEEGKLDLDKPVQYYVPEFPVKKFDGKDVTITTRMLLSHTSGLRHFEKKEDMEKGHKRANFFFEEDYSMKPYSSITEALNMFQDDSLIHEPGKTYHYTTHGWTLVSAVVEKASGKDFISYMKKILTNLGMRTTFPEIHSDMVYHRSRYYVRDDSGRIRNAPYIDNSYKWAGEGFLSSVPDLLKFGNVMLYSWQASPEKKKHLRGFLEQETVRMMWSPIISTGNATCDEYYGLGWFVYPEIKKIGCGRTSNFELTHTGSAVGASSILYICPHDNDTSDLPNGIVVAILTNLQSVELTDVARTVADEFLKGL